MNATNSGTENRRLLTVVVDALMLTVLIVLAASAFAPAYGGTRWLITAIGGAMVGMLVGAGTGWFRWHWVFAELGILVAYFLFGPGLATPTSALGGIFPSLESLQRLAVGSVTSWKQMLTVATPVGGTGILLVPVLITTLLAGALAGTIISRTTKALWATPAPVLVMVTAALLGTLDSQWPLVVGLAVGVGGVVWAAWHLRSAGGRGLDFRRPVSAAMVLLIAGGGAYFLAPKLTSTQDRLAIRQDIVPPFDPLDYPSPLSAFRKYVKADEETPMFTVSGLPADAKMRLAAMDGYTGIVYNVSTTSGAFARVGDEIAERATGVAADLSVSIDEYSGIWLPGAGQLTGIEFTSNDSSRLTESFRYAGGSGTGVVTTGLDSGDNYRLSAVLPVMPDENALLAASIGAVQLPPLTRVPEKVKAAAGQFTEGMEGPYRKVEAIRAALSSGGIISHGRDEDLDSPSGHGIDRLNQLIQDERLVGDQEQFAPTMALMVRALGIPARVVLGFAPPEGYDGTGELTVHGGDLTAWVEVNFDGFGWVAFDPTPDETQEPQETTPEKKTTPRPQVIQPPPPPQANENAKAKSVEEAEQEEEKPQEAPPTEQDSQWVLLAVIIVVPLLLILLPIALILLLKARRRRRRRETGHLPDRIAGGWWQLIDTATDLGHPVAAKRTRAESAAELDSTFGTTTLLLARDADARVFGPETVSDQDVQRFWAEVDAAGKGMSATQSGWRRFRARLSLASLRRKD